MERVRREPLRAGAAVATAAIAAVTFACGGGDRTRLLVRTDLPVELWESVEASFEAVHPDIDVRFSDAPTEGTLEEVLAGGADFDVWWGAPARALLRAEASGGLLPSAPSWASNSRDTAAPEGGAGGAFWHPWLATPLVIAFDRTVVALSDAPSDWVDVFHHAWFDDIRVPDPASTEAGATLVAGMVVEALRDDDDLNRGFDWLARLHDQVDGYVPDSRGAVDALRRGDALLAIMTRADAEIARRSEADWLHYRLPTSGTPEVVRGVGIAAGSTSTEAALAFLDYLGSDDVATAAKLHTHWEPLAGTVDDAGMPPDFELPQNWRGFAPAFDTIAAELDGWVDRWEREVRTR